MEAEVSSLFPHIVKKRLHLNLFYFDDLAEEVRIESDGDMQAALQCFMEEWDNERRKEYLVLQIVVLCNQRALVQLIRLNALQAVERYMYSIVFYEDTISVISMMP